MSDNIKYRSDRNIGPVVGACVIIMVGGVGFLIVGMLTFPGDLHIPLLGVAGFLTVALLIVWLLRDRPASSLRDRYRWVGSRRHREGLAYQPRILKARRRYGTNAPPTLDEIRELKEGLHNWVPSNTRAGRKTLKQR